MVLKCPKVEVCCIMLYQTSSKGVCTSDDARLRFETATGGLHCT